jgi:hypothetical protein
MAIVFALLLILFLLACWFLTLLGMPGNWLMVAGTAIYAYLVPAQSPATLGWRTVVVLLILAVLGEIVELLAGAMGAGRAGASRRGAVMALAGSFVGGLLGMFFGLPVPLIGSVLAAVLFAALGAMVGAVLGETSSGRNLGTTWRIAKAALWGRLAGTLGKMLIGAAMIVAVLVAMLA